MTPDPQGSPPADQDAERRGPVMPSRPNTESRVHDTHSFGVTSSPRWNRSEKAYSSFSVSMGYHSVAGSTVIAVSGPASSHP